MNKTLLLIITILFSMYGCAYTDNYSASATNFHYQDAEGNNLMLGSFAGQFAGAKSYCIHKISIFLEFLYQFYSLKMTFLLK